MAISARTSLRFLLTRRTWRDYYATTLHPSVGYHESSPMPKTLLVFDDVEVVERGPLGIRCRVGGAIVFVGALQPQPGTTVCLRGDRGRLVLLRQDAWSLGLAAPPGKS